MKEIKERAKKIVYQLKEDNIVEFVYNDSKFGGYELVNEIEKIIRDSEKRGMMKAVNMAQLYEPDDHLSIKIETRAKADYDYEVYNSTFTCMYMSATSL